MKKVSDTQTKKLRLWAKVKKARIAALKIKYGYLPCEWGKETIHRGDPHHNDGDRNNNVLSNCRIVCRFHHDYITDNNVRDVPDMLTGAKIDRPSPFDRPAELSGYHGLHAYPKSVQCQRKERNEERTA